MEIEAFVKQSEGNWISMRSGHSLAFKQFEEVLSNIKIRLLKANDQKVISFLKNTNYSQGEPISPFEIEWSGQSNWDEEKPKEEMQGSSLLIPVENLNNSGIILRSQGYAEQIEAISKYYFLSDGTIVLSTKYAQTIAEERIWFLNEHVRCRSSVIRSVNEKAILQTSFASEVRKLSS